MTRDKILHLMKAVASGEIQPQDGADQLKRVIFDNLGFATIDHHRVLRRGLPEVVFGEGKTPEQLVIIADTLRAQGDPVLITRLDSEKWSLIKAKTPYLSYSDTARCASFQTSPPNHPGRILVCTAGTSDLPVAEEAAITLETMGHPVTRITDIGIAGLHRLLGHIESLQNADVIIAVAGMEGALPSVIAGIVDCPVIAVPTSVGYGTSFGGITALLAMLNSCASGVTVVNIDNGFGAGYAAALMLRKQRSAPASSPR
ncbi:nickel pincer cofactor biosynthesis protein LarB [bacterium]|nr:nickel pincer cofactor biosynthesis protein LarB [candidate division CSSED10-310 bacterium]